MVILGPTASGKSTLAVQLAQKFNGEIISADSRQIYKGFNISSGRVTKKEMAGVPHYLLDVASPKRTFTVVQYQKLARRTIQKIWRNGKLPIICGGTGFYIQAVIDGLVMPEVKQNLKLRKRLEEKESDYLFKLLKDKDPARAGNIDPKNRRRLIRALEIIETLGNVPKIKNKPVNAEILIIGIKKDSAVLKKLIYTRLIKRTRLGLIKEVQNLHKKGLSWQRLEDLGLEYRYVAQFLKGKISKKEMIETLNREIWHYAKRQMTWFKKDKRVHWIEDYKQAQKIVKIFLK